MHICKKNTQRIHTKPQYKELTQYTQKSRFIDKYQIYTTSGFIHQKGERKEYKRESSQSSNDIPIDPLLKFPLLAESCNSDLSMQTHDHQNVT